MVAGHHKPSAADDFADLARRDLTVVIVEDPDVGAEYRLADRLELALEVLGVKNRDQPFVEPIERDEMAVELAGDPALHIRGGGRAAAHQRLEAVGSERAALRIAEQPL